MAIQAPRTSYYGGGTPPATQAPRTSYLGGPGQPGSPLASGTRTSWLGGAAPASTSGVGPMQSGASAMARLSAPSSGFRGTPPRSTPTTYGTQSGPTYVEDRYTQRANGTDPGWEYATGRAQDQINNQYAARGGYNSSGAMQSISDMYANATSQREGQLDSLAGAATSAHQNALNSMFTQGLGIDNGIVDAGKQGTAGAGDAMSAGEREKIDLLLAKQGVDQKTRQGELDAIFGVANIGAKVAGGK